jgi:uncharacterized protein YigE (DUF2233 family)
MSVTQYLPKRFLLVLISGLFLTGFLSFHSLQKGNDENILDYTIDIKTQHLKFYWKDDSSKIFGTIGSLKTWLDKKHETLKFAMNGGMYTKDKRPQGLFIQDQIAQSALDTSSGSGNFYLKPNGVFYITTSLEAKICKTSDFINKGEIKYATQSGPMLIVNGEIHPKFKEGSTNLNIRNGVGILPNKKVIFAMSKKGINFYDFALFFKKQGCMNALYLDGFVSRTYLPEKNWIQTDGSFGVIIGVSESSEK